MKLDPNLLTFLAMAVAIRRRDEVAIRQFAAALAERLQTEFEASEAERGSEVRGSEAKKRHGERLALAMEEGVQTLKLLVDVDGMSWLQQQAGSMG